MRWIGFLALGCWGGATLALAELRWFSRPSLRARLRPHSPQGHHRGPTRRERADAAHALAHTLLPVADRLGQGLGRLVGVHEPLEARLWRAHASIEAEDFRLRQFAWTVGGFLAGLALAAALRLGTSAALVASAGGAILAALWQEQTVTRASEDWQRRLFHELPVVSEQIAMLLGAGYSLTGALHRVAQRGSGACSRDLARVCDRIAQGVSEAAALREWAKGAGVGAVDRLVQVLALDRDTADLGRLISDEARNIRMEVHRGLVEHIERRAEKVWIPVTVAALLPGVIFLSVPFVAALRAFGGAG